MLFLVFLPIVAWPHCFAPMLGQQSCTGQRRREPQGPCIPFKGTSMADFPNFLPRSCPHPPMVSQYHRVWQPSLNTWFLGGCSSSILYHMARDEMRQDGTAVHRMGWHGMRPKTHGSGAVVLFWKELFVFFRERKENGVSIDEEPSLKEREIKICVDYYEESEGSRWAMNLSRLEKSNKGWNQRELTSVMPIILVCCMHAACVRACVRVWGGCTCDVPGQGGCCYLYCSLLYALRQGLSLTLELDWSLSPPPSLALGCKCTWPHCAFYMDAEDPN